MESKFTAGLLDLIVENIVEGILLTITLGLGLPWVVARRQKWMAQHTIIDGHQVTFDGTGGQLFGSWIKWVLLTLITVGIYGFWLSIKMQQWISAHTHLV